ncbi:hypothetical protein H8F24_10905 [Synechococcus sp. CBW1002]|uniref:hypothetical protein n=1 Tax=unclassified Synechococcus TaxID=2626047 RepID=UPI0018CEEAE9|nr:MULTISPECIES: hypothetical protein [unclassified Synechococcus]QPN58696.1 hypothetical protein H8F24_10905 [Synechococcus sp. CBW1002]QPN65430.1 hypothetical protein H8F26_10525 [Synechococcus sp. CBW1006]
MPSAIRNPIPGPLRGLRRRLGRVLLAWGEALDPPPPPTGPASLPVGSLTKAISPAAAQCPALREPLSVENAVLNREMTVLKREVSDALAALAAAHALVTSARLAQVQAMRAEVDDGAASADALMALAADYQGWQSDQVRLFDALGLVLRMKVPPGNVLDQVDPRLHEQARSHLEGLSLEYQRGLLMQQFHPPG